MGGELVTKDDTQATAMDSIQAVSSLLEEGMYLSKCVKCGCMNEALESIASSLRSPKMDGHADLREEVKLWLAQIRPPEYT
jgi:hypothetical protein